MTGKSKVVNLKDVIAILSYDMAGYSVNAKWTRDEIILWLKIMLLQDNYERILLRMNEQIKKEQI